MFKLCLLIAAFIPLLSTVANSQAIQDPVIVLTAEDVAAGATLGIRIDSQFPLSNLALEFEDQRGHLFHPPGAPAGQTAGLVAIPFEAKAGPRRLSLRWTQADQPRQRLLAFTVTSGAYRSEKLKVDPGKVNPKERDRQRAAREAREVRRIYGSAAPLPKWLTAFQKPLASHITSPFGNRRLFNGQLTSYHSGIDFRAPPGTPVKAANRGSVRLAKELFYAGNTVLIDHGAGVYTIYAHLSRIGVGLDQPVEKGQVIGWSGQSGRVSGPHLHWGVKLNGRNVDPLQFMTVISKLAD